MSQAWFHVKQTPGSVGWSPHWGQETIYLFPLECLKKACTGRQPPGQSRRPSAGLSLVTLISVLFLPFKWVIKKPYLMTCERRRS